MGTPKLTQCVKFGERYVSSALNRKLSGIIDTGIYHGFVVTPGTGLSVNVKNDEKYPYSVAVVERDVWSITVSMTDGGTVEIPGAGTWYVVIEAYYSECEPGYQYITVTDKAEKHHVVIAKVTVADGATSISDKDIDYSENTVSGAEISSQLTLIANAVASSNTWIRKTVEVTDAITENADYILPDNVEYTTGKHLVSVSYDGVECYEGSQFEEVTQADKTTSNAIRFLFPVPADSELQITLRGYADLEKEGVVTDYAGVMSQLNNILERIKAVEDAATLYFEETK